MSASRVTRKHGALDDLHAREERVEVVADHVLERQQQPTLADRDEARQLLGHLHAREALLARVGVARQHAEAQREPRDVRERLARPDAERRQHREDLALVEAVELGQLLALAVGHPADVDALRRERRSDDLPPEARQLARQPLDPRADRGERLARRQPVVRAHREARGGLIHQPRDAHHEELVQVRGEDRAELDALEQRHALVRGQLQHALVEVEPRQLAVEQRRRSGSGRLGHVPNPFSAGPAGGLRSGNGFRAGASTKLPAARERTIVATGSPARHPRARAGRLRSLHRDPTRAKAAKEQGRRRAGPASGQAFLTRMFPMRLPAVSQASTASSSAS